jgi:hypothetical protein
MNMGSTLPAAPPLSATHEEIRGNLSATAKLTAATKAQVKKIEQQQKDLKATADAVKLGELKKRTAKLTLLSSVNGANVMQAYEIGLGKNPEIGTLVAGLNDTFDLVKGGKLHMLEEMLVSQAMALQTIFTSLARRAQAQEYQRNLEAFLGMALKAQAQSRATISALVDLKFPRQVSFVKQTNTAHGPQQVNNGTATDQSTRTKEIPSQHNELLEDSHGGTYLDIGATAAAARGNPEMEAVAAIDRPQEPCRQASSLPQRALDRTSSDSRCAEATK